MKTKESLRAVGYIRVSTAGQKKEGESLTTQKTQIEEHCQRHNLSLIEIYADEGISGKDQDRPDLLRLLADAESKKFDMVVVTKLTRFGRSARDLSNNIGQLDDNKILFVSLKESLDTSNAAGRLLRGILMNIAEFEHETIFTQMAENRNIRWASGKIHMGQSPFGYRWDKEKRCFEINPDEGAIYKRIIDWYLNGESYKTICIKLRDMGIKCKRAYFSPATIGGVLKNPCYTGKYTVNKKVFKDKLKSKVDKPIEENIVIELPPLMTKVKWLKVQERIAFNVVKTKRTVFPEFWLRNVLECEECNSAIRPKVGGYRNKRGAKLRYYGCYWHIASGTTLKSYGKEKCKLPYIRAEELEDSVMYYLIHYLTFGSFTLKGKYVPSEVESLIDAKRFDAQILSLTSQLSQFKHTLSRKSTAKAALFEMLETEGVDKNQFLSQMAKLSDEEQTLSSLIEESQAKLTDLERHKDNTGELVDFIQGNREWAKNIGERIVALPFTDKQRLIEGMVHGKIPVSLRVEENGVEHWDIDPKFAFNINILQALADEDKLGKFNSR